MTMHVSELWDYCIMVLIKKVLLILFCNILCILYANFQQNIQIVECQIKNNNFDCNDFQKFIKNELTFRMYNYVIFGWVCLSEQLNFESM